MHLKSKLKIHALRLGTMIIFSSSLFMMESLAVAEDAGSGQARVVQLEGTVTVKSGSEWIPVAKGSYLPQGSEMKVGENSSSMVTLGEGRASAIKVDSESAISLTSLDPVKINLQSGKLIALVNKLSQGSTFQVMTSTATATVRGTQFLMSDHTVAVLEGVVDVDISGQLISVNANQELDVDSKQTNDISAENVETISQAQAESTATTSLVNAGEGARQNIQIPSSP